MSGRSIRRDAFVAVGVLVALLSFPGLARATPPPNDNRATAEVIPSFPANDSGNDRRGDRRAARPAGLRLRTCRGHALVPHQPGSRRNRGASTFRAPGSGQTIRVYDLLPEQHRRARLRLGGEREAKGDRLVRGTDRGKSYLVMVGKRPGTADANVHADGAPLPAAAERHAPPGEADHRTSRPRSPGQRSARRVTVADPDGCRLERRHGVVQRCRRWCPSESPCGSTAAGDFDASMAVVKKVHSRVERRWACRATDTQGRPGLAVGLDTRRHVRDRGRPAGGIAAGQLRPRRARSPAGRARAGTLPRRREHHTSTLNGLTDVNDIWWVTLRGGHTYRIALNSTGCPGLRPFRREAGELRHHRLQGVHHLHAGPRRRRPLRARVAYHSDDGRRSRTTSLLRRRPGLTTWGSASRSRTSSTVHASLQPRGVDLVDIYHFDVGERSGRAAPPGRQRPATRWSC